MRFLSARELRGNAARVWEELPIEREMVVTTNGRPVAILTTVGDSDLEESLAAATHRMMQTKTDQVWETARGHTSHEHEVVG